MRLIDTHTHIYLEEFNTDRDQVIESAKSSGISVILLPNVDSSTIDPLTQLCENVPDFAFPMMGLHPTGVKASSYVSELKKIEQTLTLRKYYAIGEIGIDLYWDQTFLKEQKIVFEEQLIWSIEMQLPISIHTRNAFAEVFDSIYKIGVDKLKGVFHSFTGNEDDLIEIQKMPNFKIGINGVVTFKKSHLPDIIKQVPLKMILLETDAPYLAPVPYRGKRNELVYIWETTKKLAEIYQLDIHEMARQTFLNSIEIFPFIKEYLLCKDT
ncbi:MAG: TatD family hydrolase [Tannerella sp.]|jgi:TatD DNase family protein|nr:TatD family hydrolase [Tannerella sp.]